MDAHSQDTERDGRSGGTGPGSGQRLDARPPLSMCATVSAPDGEVPDPQGAGPGSSSTGPGTSAPDPRVAALRRFAAAGRRRRGCGSPGAPSC
jgi:hypothetical protein